jgi:hypothetical protein
MNKEFIPYEQALELKELGFDEPCFGKIYADGGSEQLSYPYKNSDQIGKITSCSAPLYQQVFRWFREKYQLSSWIYTSYDEKFYYSILKDKRFMISEFYTVTKIKIPNKIYNTYEESELACLNKLIRIVKKYYDNGGTL